jgi:hypothetical protein
MSSPSNAIMARTAAGLLGLAILMASAPGAAGVCVYSPLVVAVPRTRPVPLNVHALVEIRAELLPALDPASTAIAFVGEGSHVPARVLLALKQGESRLQLWLEPATDLAPRTAYHLAFAPLDPVTPERQELLARANELPYRTSFTTGTDRDDVTPAWRGGPRAGKSYYSTDKGSIIANFIELRAPLGKNFTGYLLVHAENKTRSEPPIDALFPVSAERSEIGQVDCTSLFEPAAKSLYAVTVTAVSLGGMRAPAPGKPIQLWFERGG